MSTEVNTLASRAAVCTMAAYALAYILTTHERVFDQHVAQALAVAGPDRRLRRDDSKDGHTLMLFVGGEAHGDIRNVPTIYTQTQGDFESYEIRHALVSLQGIGAATVTVYATRDATHGQLVEAVSWAAAEGELELGRWLQ